MSKSKYSPDRASEDDSDTKPCLACKEAIKIDATVCPCCHTSQVPARWRIVGNTLKWIGGITAVITLIAGMIQINTLYRNWRDRQEAVTELVRAAEIQSKSGDYEGAWQLVENAITLEPGSHFARNKQVHLAMEWLRTIWIKKNRKATDIVNMLVPILYRGVVNTKTDIVADAFAHLGWADHLRYREGMTSLNVESHFARSLEIDDKNVYAHAMWAYWIMLPEAKYKYGADRIGQSKYHFLTALNTGKKREYVRRLQIQAFLDTDALDREVAEVETIKLANEIRKNNERLALDLRIELLETYRILIFEGEHERAIRLPKLLFAAIPPEELLDTFTWLSQDIDYVYVKPMYYDISAYKFIVARLTEEMGDLPNALKKYQAIQSETDVQPNVQSRLDKAIERILNKIKN